MDGNMSEHDHGEAGASPCGVMNGHHGHGSLEGHVLPGSMFVLWSAWWMLNMFSCYLTSSPRKPFLARSWYPFPWAKHIPLEPLVKVGLTFIGVIVELVVAGHGTPRKLIKDGCFVTEHLNNWQHAVMYGAFMLSGLVDLVGFYTAIPRGTEQAFLTMAFFNEGILMAFHLKGTDLDKRLHFILALIIFACALFCALEAAWPQNNTMAAGKAAVLMLQGTWFIQVGVILYTHKTWWDPSYGGADMFVPVVLVWHVLIIMTCMLAGFASWTTYSGVRKASMPGAA